MKLKEAIELSNEYKLWEAGKTNWATEKGLNGRELIAYVELRKAAHYAVMKLWEELGPEMLQMLENQLHEVDDFASGYIGCEGKPCECESCAKIKRFLARANNITI